MRSGQTIGEQRERLETASERTAIHKKTKRKKTIRLVATIITFIVVICLIAWGISSFSVQRAAVPATISETISIPYAPTIEVIDEDASLSGGRLTSRMKEYIGQAESDLREYGITPVKAVIPSGTIRELHFYLDGYTGFVKMTIDRGAGVSAEDTNRMLHYLESIGVADFQYIDVRIDGKAYWK